MQCYSVIKRKEVVVNITMWSDLENIMLYKKEPKIKRFRSNDSIYVKYPEDINPYRQKKAD